MHASLATHWGERLGAPYSVIRFLPLPCSWDRVILITEMARGDDTRQYGLERAERVSWCDFA